MKIIDVWAEELSKKLGRPAEVIRTQGLSAEDFSPSVTVSFVLGDKSRGDFNFAFYVLNVEKRQFAVFTEHCGYHIYPLHGALIKQVHEDVYIDEDYEA